MRPRGRFLVGRRPTVGLRCNFERNYKYSFSSLPFAMILERLGSCLFERCPDLWTTHLN